MSFFLKLEASRKNEQQAIELRNTCNEFIKQQKLGPGTWQLKTGKGKPVEFVVERDGTLGEIKQFNNRAERRKHYRELRRK